MKILSCLLVYFVAGSIQSQPEYNFYSDEWLNILTAAENNTIIDVAKQLGANTLVQLLEEAKLTSTLSEEGPFTLFAPSDAAFAALPPEVVSYFKRHPKLIKWFLLYHVNPQNTSSKDFKNEQLLKTLLRKTEIRINIYSKNNVSTATGNRISKPDQQASNGIVHLVDGVLFKIPVYNMVQVLKKARDFRMLKIAIKIANMQSKLLGGPFTLFAPPNSAFKKLPPNVIQQLLKNKTALAEVLSYHVVNGTYFSAGLMNGSVPTVQGDSINVTVSANKTTINNATVIFADLPVSNGVIQVIDEVLFPPQFKMNLQIEQPYETESLVNDFFNYISNYDNKQDFERYW